LEEFQQRIREIVSSARRNIEKAQGVQKLHHDKHHSLAEFKVGELVWLSTTNLTLPGPRKLQPRFVGPFKILERKGDVSYELELPASMQQLCPIFHVKLLKKYLPPRPGQEKQKPLPITLDSEGD